MNITGRNDQQKLKLIVFKICYNVEFQSVKPGLGTTKLCRNKVCNTNVKGRSYNSNI